MRDGPWRNAGFARLWSGYTISTFGNQVTLLALPLAAVLALGAGAVETGLIVAARMTPYLLMSLVIGVWVDRLPRRPVLIAADLGSALVVGSVPVAAVLGVLRIEQLYLVALLGGLFAVATDLARSALVPALVGRERLVAANSSIQSSWAVAQVAGPAAGGILVQLLTAPIALAADAVSFLASAVFIALIRVRELLPPRDERRSVWHEIREGLSFVRSEPIVLRVVLAIALANVEWFGVQAILVLYATRDLGLPPAVLGAALALSGPTSILGALSASRIVRRWGLGPTMIAALGIEAASRLVLPLAGGPTLAAAAVLGLSQLLIGFVVPLWVVASLSLRQAVTPERLLGRVNAAASFVGFGVAPFAALGAGLLGEAVGLRPTLAAAGLIALLAFGYLAASPVRAFRQPSSEATPVR